LITARLGGKVITLLRSKSSKYNQWLRPNASVVQSKLELTLNSFIQLTEPASRL